METREFTPSPLARAVRQPHSLRRVLEKRLLLDASAPAESAGVHQPAGMGGPDGGGHGVAPAVDEPGTPGLADMPGHSDIPADSEPRHEVVVIDMQVEGADELVDDLLQQADSSVNNGDNVELQIGAREITLYTIDSGDGVTTIGEILDNHEDIDALHLVTHGGAGGIDIGGDTLTLDTLENYSGELQGWSANLSGGADILLYGCDISYSQTGKSFLLQFSQLTGADIAASDDPTGSIARGGDWDLEYQRGPIETEIVFSQLLQGEWDGLLAAVPSATVDAADEDFINETTDVDFAFDNNDVDTGYGPFMDVVLGPGMTVESVDGFLGATFIEYTVVDGQWVDDSGTPVEFHPYDVNQTGDIPLPPVGPEGSHWYAIQLPFGSFTPDQPAYEFTATVLLDEAAGAVVGVPIPIYVRPGFMFGEDPLNNPDTDPPIVGPEIITDITPTVMLIDKEARDGDGDNDSIGDDGETVTGPSEPVTWAVTVDIANMSPVEDLVVTEEVPNNFYYLPGNVVVTDSAGNTLVEGTDYTLSEPPEGANNDAELVVTFLNPVTGTPADDDIVITYTGYVPDVDANGDPIVINDGANDAVTNTASATGSYQDQAVSDDDSDTISATATAVQKDVALIDDTGSEGFTPGDGLEYTLTMEVSDFMQLEDLVLSDTIQDGIEVDPASVQFTLFVNGTTVGPDAFDPANFTLVENPDPGDGGTELTFDLSQELIDRSISDGSLDGDLFADGVTDGTTTITITYQASIREAYIGAPRAGTDNEAVDAFDTITNQATIDASAASAGGQAVDNGSTEEVVIEGAESEKSVYAVNGNTDPVDEITIGDEVTFAVNVDLSTLDSQGIVVTDYLPLPVFEAMAPTFFDTSMGANTPGVNEWGFGPDTEFGNWPPGYLDGGSVTTSADPANNSITWEFDVVEQDASIGGEVQLLFTVEVQDEPFTDGLFLTNVATVEVNGTETTAGLPPDGIQVEILTPAISVTKGVIDTDDDNGVIDPTPPGPVTFDPAGTAPAAGTPPWSGDITSPDLDTTPIDSDLSNVDAGDTVRFAIVMENSGGSDAFDIVISDTLPDGFEIPGGDPANLNLQVYTGDGTEVGFTVNPEDLFGAGITLTDPTADEGALNEGRDPDTGDTTDGSNVIVITYDLVASADVQPNQQIENTAQLEAYGGLDGGNDYTEGNSSPNWQDDAEVQIRENTVDKTLVGTSITTDTNAALDEAVIGEVITYSMSLTIAEGLTPSASVVDTLDNGLEFIQVTDVTVSPDITSTGDLSVAGLTPTVSGQQLTFDLGDLTNANRDNAVDETITITYEVLVQDVAANQNGDQKNNSAQFLWDSTADMAINPTVQDTDSAANVTVIEPLLEVEKTLVDTPLPVDAGDTVTYQIVISHADASATDAYDLTFSDELPAAQMNTFTLISVTNSNGTDLTPLFEIDGTTLQTVPGADVDLLQDETITIEVSAVVNATIPVGSDISNTATTDWTSIDGDGPDADNERTGADGEGGAVDDYETSDTLVINVETVQAVGKRIVSSSVIDPLHNNDVTEGVIGEELTYAVAFFMPEGVINDAEILDTLPEGVEFLRLEQSFVGDNITPIDVDVTIPPEGATGQISFAFGDIQNEVDNMETVDDIVGLVYTVRIQDVASNQAGTELTNLAEFRFDANQDGDNTNDGSITASSTATVVEPDVSISKGITPATGDNGDEVTYTIEITNDPAATTANDLTFSDPLPAELSDVSFTVILDQDGTQTDISEQFEIVGGELQTTDTADIDLLPGGTITVEVTGTLTDVVIDSTISNTATVDWTSLDGDSEFERTGADGEGGALDDYEASADVDLTVPPPQIEKTLVETSQNDELNDDTEATIGEIATFQVTVTLPEGQLTGQLFDNYGPGFTFVDLVSVTASNPDAIDVDPDQITVINNPATNTIGLDFGTLVNTDTDNATTETITFTYRVQVADVDTNQDGTTLTNDAVLNYDTDGNGIPDAQIDDSASVDVVEPAVIVDKALLSPAPPAPLTLGGTAQYQITVQLDPSSTADAYDVHIEDALPPYLSGVDNVQIDVTGGNPEVVDNSADNMLDLDISVIDSDTVITITIDAQVVSDPAAVGQEITNTTNVEWTSIDGDNNNERTGADGEDGALDDYATSDDVTTPIEAFDLFVDKDDGGIDETNPAEPGDTVIYTIDFGNSGTADASGVVITETLPPNTTFDPDNSSEGWVDNGDGTFSIAVGDLAAGDTGSVQFAVTINEPLPTGVEDTNNTVTIDDDGTHGIDFDPDNNSDDDNTPIDAAPDYVIDKIEDFDDPAFPGETISWTIIVSNEGNQDGTGVVVTDTLPDSPHVSNYTASDGGVVDEGAGTVTWDIGDLAAGESVTLTLTGEVASEGVPPRVPTSTNTVEVTDDGTNGPDPTPENNTDSEDFDITEVDLVITKDDGDSTTVPGGSITYTLEYGNNGSAPAENVEIVETLPDHVTFDAANSDPNWVFDEEANTVTLALSDLPGDDGILDPGETGSVTFTVIVDDPLPAGVDEILNTTIIHYDDGLGPDQNIDDNEDDDNTPVEAAPDYVIDKIENFEDPANPGDTIEWTIEVSNQGNQDGTGVVVTDTLPDTSLFHDFVASDGGVIDLAAGTVTWNIGDLAAGDSVTLTLSAVVNDSVPDVIPTQTNSVVVDDDGNNGPDPTPDNNNDNENFDIEYVDLAIDKDDGGITAEPGDTVVYTLNYENNGTADADNVVITETLPDFATFDAGSSTDGWVDNGDGTFSIDVGTVAAGTDGSVQFAVTTVNPLPAGVEETTNLTTIEDDGGHGPDHDPDDNNDDDNTPIEAAPDYMIDKIEEFEDPANPGDTVSWTIEVSNQGNQDGTGVFVVDTLPDTSLFHDFVASNDGVIDLAAGTVTWTIGDMAVGDSVTLTLSAVVNDSVPDVIPTQTNSVVVDDDGNNGPDPTPDNNNDNENFDIEYVDLAIDKDDGGITAEPGETVVYTLNYENNGTADADNVVITETLPDFATFDAGSSTDGWVDNGDGTFSIDVGTVAAGTGGSVQFAVTIVDPLPAGVEETTNLTTIEDDGGHGPDRDPDDNTDGDNTPIDGRPDYVIDKMENFEDPANPGDPIAWTITVSNEGDQDGTGVVVTDTLPDTSLFHDFVASNGGVIDLAAGTVTWNIGDLAVGDSVTLTLSAVVNDSVPDVIPTQTNSVVVDDDGENGEDRTPDNNNDNENFDIEYVDLFIDKDDNNITAEPGDTVVYTLTYANNGTADADNVVITETLPDFATFDAANSSDGWVDNGDGTFSIDVGTVPAGTGGSVQFAVTIVDPLPAGIDMTANSATINDDGGHGPDHDPDDNTDGDNTPIDGRPDYVIDKVENFDDPANPGDPIEWTITVSNEGNQDGTGVVVTDTLPDTSLFHDFVASDGGVIDLAAGTVTWNIGDLAVGETVTLTVSAVVNDTIPATTPAQTNSVDVTDDGNNGDDPTPDNNTDNEPFEVLFVDLVIDKDDGGAFPGPEDSYIYTLNFQNQGNATATGVVITETLPPNTSFDAANSTSGWVQNGDVFTFNVGELGPGESGSVQFAVTVDARLQPTVLETDNTATIIDDGGNGPDPTPENNTDGETTEIDNLGPQVDNITLSELHWQMQFAERPPVPTDLEMYGRLISRETELVTANLQGSRGGHHFDPAFGTVDGLYYPNDWSPVFSQETGYWLSPTEGEPAGDTGGPLQLPDHFAGYRANSLFDLFGKALISAENDNRDHPLQKQLDEVVHDLDSAGVSPLMGALARQVDDER